MIFCNILNITLFVVQFISNVGIFYPKGASRSYYICFVTTHSLRGGKRRGNLMSLRKLYEVTTLSAIVRDELHGQMPRICSNLGP